mmetsp:Transcript_13142/g.20631  ORF Transcript_13142/g.20631 Transcript_13142/m.20631 type:complete len:106 (+) Transcript_13142:506-823(+)
MILVGCVSSGFWFEVKVMARESSDVGFRGHRLWSELGAKSTSAGKVEFPDHTTVSEDAKDFIHGLLKKDPKERTDAAAALKHPWITKEIEKNSQLREHMKLLGSH